jgi:Rrf2 family protein
VWRQSGAALFDTTSSWCDTQGVTGVYIHWIKNLDSHAMISQTAEYALRAIVFLAGQGQTPRTTVEIAAATQVPVGYLAKVMQNLSRAGLVNSQRGLGGGFVLVDAPEKLTVYAVVDAVDPIKRFPKCPLGMADHGERLCPLHSRLDEAAELVEKSFIATTVADLISMPRGKRRPCTFPAK